MANHYKYGRHSFVTLKVPHGVEPLQNANHRYRTALDIDGPLYGPHGILFVSDDRVWFYSNFDLVGFYEELRQVREGNTRSMGDGGECIISAPASWCKFYDEAEASVIAECLEIDTDILTQASKRN